MDPAAIAAILLMSVRRRFDKFIGLLHEALFACAPLAISSREPTSKKLAELLIARNGQCTHISCALLLIQSFYAILPPEKMFLLERIQDDSRATYQWIEC